MVFRCLYCCTVGSYVYVDCYTEEILIRYAWCHLQPKICYIFKRNVIQISDYEISKIFAARVRCLKLEFVPLCRKMLQVTP